MPVASGRMELWRRLALLLGVLVGVGLFFYVAPEMVSVRAVNWEQEQADELRPYSGFVTQEERRLGQLPLAEYIREKTGGRVAPLDYQQWGVFFRQVQLASSGRYDDSTYGDRVSEKDKDDFWKPTGLVWVYFKPGELSFAEWGLLPVDGDQLYVSTTAGGKTAYLLLYYQDYHASLNAFSNPYRSAPGWLYHPYRNAGIGVIAFGLLLYIFLPRRRSRPEDIAYSRGSMLAGDVAAVILLLPFYVLPFIISGGTVQAFTAMWPITLAMWLLAFLSVALLYYNAWNSSYRIELTPGALHLVTFKGVRECRFDEITAANIVSLRNPGWFRKLFLAVALLSLFSGRGGSLQPAGSALLAESAAYSGLEIQAGGGKPLYIWFSDQRGAVIIPNFERVLQAIEAAGVRINQEPREIEGFSMFM
ncbi:MAG: hypothetical protein HPY50_10960 [Firmicutes bacterium]|nr:hypothetical protein [Bacillota bacterium]